MLLLRSLRASPLGVVRPRVAFSATSFSSSFSTVSSTASSTSSFSSVARPTTKINVVAQLFSRQFSSGRTASQVKMNNKENPNLKQKYSQHGPFSIAWNVTPPFIKFFGLALFFFNCALFITMPILFIIVPPFILLGLWFRSRIASSQIGVMNQRWVGMAQQALVYKCKGPLDLQKLNRVCVNRIHEAINDDERDINSILKVDPFGMSRNGQSLTLDPTGRISQSSMLYPRETKVDTQNPFDNLPGREEMIAFEELLLDKSIEGTPKQQVIGVVDVVLTHDASFDPFATHYAEADNEFRYRLEVRPAKTLFPESSDVVILSAPAPKDTETEDVTDHIIDVDPVDKEHFGDDKAKKDKKE
ncbi:hypothetical protein CJU90_5694 [Yarrowia sp. C11]|nr:hypothetical protein CJU90_5694 [Yarrowia sp. C11]KAG5364278.1 hypothetical protein CKK34_3072 [Yarrowia sp. E02]